MIHLDLDWLRVCIRRAIVGALLIVLGGVLFPRPRTHIEIVHAPTWRACLDSMVRRADRGALAWQDTASIHQIIRTRAAVRHYERTHP